MLRRIKRFAPFPGGDLYSERIQEFSGNLVAHWPLNELSGTVAYDKSIGQFNGAITTTTLGQAGIGDGLTSQYFDGANDYIDISAIASDLMLNGGFETAGAGGADVHASWTESAGDGAIANEVVEIHTGADSLKLTAGASANTLDDQNITVVVGGVYELKFWTEGDGADEGQYNIYDNDNAADIVALTGTGVTAAAFAKVTQSFTAPVGCTSVRVRLQCSTTNAAVSYFDTVSLRRTDIPTFDPHEGSVIVWAKVDGAGVWTDAALRSLINIYVDSSNRIRLYKSDTNSKLSWRYEGNNVDKQIDNTSMSATGWVPFGLTWSLSGDAVKAYNNRVQEGATQSGLGVISGILLSTNNTLGASNVTPAWIWHGNLAHAQIYNTPLSATQMKYLMTLP